MTRLSFLCLALSLTSGAVCRADAIYDVTLNTTPLMGNANAPFALDFQLTSGDTGSGVVNRVTLSHFHFGAAGAAESGRPFSNSGNASGNLGSAVTLITSGGTFFNEFSQYFTPGGTLTFQLDLTDNAEPPPTPDEFTFQLIDKTTGEVSTTDPSGSDSLVVIDLVGSTLHPQIYTTNGDGVSITPQLPSASAIPEPGTIWLLAMSGLLLAIGRRARRT